MTIAFTEHGAVNHRMEGYESEEQEKNKFSRTLLSSWKDAGLSTLMSTWKDRKCRQDCKQDNHQTTFNYWFQTKI